MTQRSSGTCIECRESFNIQTDIYVAYGGGIWCSESCFAEWAVDAKGVESDFEKIEDEMEVRNVP